MAITNIAVSNFKSFKELNLDLGRFSVVIGANAAGKSNFVELFKFLRDIEHNDLDDAISLHGGSSSIANAKLGSLEPVRMHVTADRPTGFAGGWAGVQVYETMYGFSLQFGSPPDGVRIQDDHFTQKLRTGVGDENVEISLDIFMLDGTRNVKIGPQELVDGLADERHSLDYVSLTTLYHYMKSVASVVEMWKAEALLIRANFFGLMGLLDSLFGGVGTYDIDPHVVKRPCAIAGRVSLEEDAKNLPLVLNRILRDPDRKRKLHNLIHDLLPFVGEVGTEKFPTGSVQINLKESYYSDPLLAHLLSDGTMDVAALVVALYFEDRDVVIIEEPERNLHPRLIGGVVEMMKDASRNRQIIVTTHSPEVVKHAGLENLLLISRDKAGFSTISRPGEKEGVKAFLEHELGLDDLFVQDLLSAP